jgi:hypothetical protein
VVERADIEDLVALVADDGLAQQRLRIADALGRVDVADRTLGQPDSEELVGGAFRGAGPAACGLVSVFKFPRSMRRTFT